MFNSQRQISLLVALVVLLSGVSCQYSTTFMAEIVSACPFAFAGGKPGCIVCVQFSNPQTTKSGSSQPISLQSNGQAYGGQTNCIRQHKLQNGQKGSEIPFPDNCDIPQLSTFFWNLVKLEHIAANGPKAYVTTIQKDQGQTKYTISLGSHDFKMTPARVNLNFSSVSAAGFTFPNGACGNFNDFQIDNPNKRMNQVIV